MPPPVIISEAGSLSPSSLWELGGGAGNPGGAEAKAAADRAAAEQAAAEPAQMATAETAAALRSTTWGSGLLRSAMSVLSLSRRSDAQAYAKHVDEEGDGCTPLHLLCRTTELQVVDLDTFLLKHIPAASMADENGCVPLHDLLETERPRELQDKLVARYIELAPDAAGYADAQGKLPAESLFTIPNLSARHFVSFIKLAPNPLLPCVSIAAALVKAAARNVSRRSVYLRVAEELTVVSTTIVRGLPSLKEDGYYPYADDWKKSVPLLLPAELLPPIASLQVRHTTASGSTNLS